VYRSRNVGLPAGADWIYTRTSRVGIMQKQSIMLVGLTMTLGSAVHAAAPLPPALLGEVFGILSYCESIDRRDEDKFEKWEKSFSKGLSEHDLDLVKKNPSYQTNFKLMQSIFRSMPADQGLELCRNAEI
jgi:hypothetical protein